MSGDNGLEVRGEERGGSCTSDSVRKDPSLLRFIDDGVLSSDGRKKGRATFAVGSSAKAIVSGLEQGIGGGRLVKVEETLWVRHPLKEI